MESLLAVPVTWLSMNFGLPATGGLSSCGVRSSAQMLELRYAAVKPARSPRATGGALRART
jgi:hypothetical protein